MKLILLLKSTQSIIFLLIVHKP